MSGKDPILEPFGLKHLTLKNRIFSSAHEPAYREDAKPQERYRLYHEEKAKCGLALCLMGCANVSPDSPSAFGQIYVGNDDVIPHFQKMADTTHKIVAVGAGPGGLEAARVRAERVHDVVVFEAASLAGGQIRVAENVPRRRELAGIGVWRLAELEHLGVPIHYKTYFELKEGSINRGQMGCDAIVEGRPQATKPSPEGGYYLFHIGDAVEPQHSWRDLRRLASLQRPLVSPNEITRVVKLTAGDQNRHRWRAESVIATPA